MARLILSKEIKEKSFLLRPFALIPLVLVIIRVVAWF
jgi:hypothetical protein